MEKDLVKVNKEIVELVSKLSALENKIKEIKELEAQYDTFKKKLFEVMVNNDITKYETPNGVVFAIVKASTDKVKLEPKFNEDKFREENPKLYKKYVEIIEKITKGKASYLRVTVPKNEGGISARDMERYS